MNLYGERPYIYRPDCPNCGKEQGAVMGSTNWGHGHMCCSEACGKHMGMKIESGLYPNLTDKNWYDPMSSDSGREQDLRARIKELEGQLRSWDLKPIKTRPNPAKGYWNY